MAAADRLPGSSDPPTSKHRLPSWLLPCLLGLAALLLIHHKSILRAWPAKGHPPPSSMHGSQPTTAPPRNAMQQPQGNDHMQQPAVTLLEQRAALAQVPGGASRAQQAADPLTFAQQQAAPAPLPQPSSPHRRAKFRKQHHPTPASSSQTPTRPKSAFFSSSAGVGAAADGMPTSAAVAVAPGSLSLEAAVQLPVRVHLSTSHPFDRAHFHRTVPDCTFQGHPIKCVWGHPDPASADVLWYHGCHPKVPIHKLHPHQLTVNMFMESAVYYPCLSDLHFMDQADVEMTYRLCSHVVVHYFDFTRETVASAFFSPPEPFESKQDAVVFANKNCATRTGRDAMIQALMDTGKIPVHAYGHCLRNMGSQPLAFDKLQLFRGYKFCVAIENTAAKDYVTEKIWQAFTAGCVPIYLGAPNIKDFLPDDNSIILWSDFSNADAVADELLRLMRNKSAYEEKLRWKRFASIKQLNLGLRQLMGMDVAPRCHSQCQLCQLAMGQRVSPRQLQGTHCMRNASWLQDSSTSWTPQAEGYARVTDAVDFHLPGGV